MFSNLKFQHGKSYKIKLRRLVVEYLYDKDDFYEVHKTSNGKKSDKIPWILYKELAGSMRAYIGFPKTSEGVTITCIDDGEVMLGGDKKEVKKKSATLKK